MYELELPSQMSTRRIHNKFHAHLLRLFKENDENLFPKWDASYYYDYGEPDDTEWEVDEILTHRWTGNRIEFLVCWELGDTTWEPYGNMAQVRQLDDYLDILGVKDWKDLPKKLYNHPGKPKVSHKGMWCMNWVSL